VKADVPGPALILAVVDSGVALTHPDLAGAGVTLSGAVTGSRCFTPPLTAAQPCVDETPTDPFGHGTLVGGIAAARTNNAVGVAGASWNARVRPLRIIQDSGTFTGKANKLDFLQAVDAARAGSNAATVVNVSAGIGPPVAANACDTLTPIVSQVMVVAAAGNLSSSDRYYPADCPGVLGVANTTTDASGADILYTGSLGSNYGLSAGLAAPGTNIKSTSTQSCSSMEGLQFCTPGQDYGSATGTSFAAPLVSGVAILMKTLDPSLTAPGLIAMLKATAARPSAALPFIAVPGTANANTNLRRIDACAAVLYTRPATLSFDPSFSRTGTIPENEVGGAAGGPSGDVGRLLPSCDKVTYTIDSVRDSNNVLVSTSPFTVEHRTTGSDTAQVLRLVSGASLNFEQSASYQVTVKMEVNGGSSASPPGATATRTLTVNVTNVNEAPTVVAPASIPVIEDVPSALTGISFSDPDAGNNLVVATFAVSRGVLSATSGSGVSVAGTSTNRTLTGSIANINAFIVAGGLKYTTAANDTNPVTLGVSISDQGNTGSGGPKLSGVTNVTINVIAVNDAPALDPIADLKVIKNSGLQSVALRGISAGPGESQTLTVTATSSNPALIPTPVAVSYASPNPTGGLTFTPVANATGSATISVTVRDNGGTANNGLDFFTRTFNVEVANAFLDGQFEPGEWNNTIQIPVNVNLPEGGTAAGTIFIKNDAANLYIALRLPRTTADVGSSVAVEFDTNRDGVLSEGDDAIVLNPAIGLFDDYRTTQPPCPPAAGLCGLEDTQVGGRNDGAGGFANNGTFSIWEMSHPLNSGDTRDNALSVGDTIGMHFMIRLLNASNVIADTFVPGGTFAGAYFIYTVAP
jgi:hypothetical protein